MLSCRRFSSEQEAVVSVRLRHEVLLADEGAQCSQGPLHKVADADGEHRVVQLHVNQVEQADDENDYVVVQVAVQVPLEGWEVDVLVAHQVEWSPRILLLEHKGYWSRVHESLPEVLLRDESDLAIINLSHGFAEHVIHDALFALLAYDFGLLLGQALFVDIVQIFDILDHFWILLPALCNRSPTILLNCGPFVL